MKKKLVSIIILCLLFTSAQAQKRPLSWKGAVQAGILEGEQGGAFQLGASGGLQWKQWSAWLGTGLDYYGVRSIPFHLTLQHNIFKMDKTPFVFAGAGHHFLWPKQNEGMYWPQWEWGQRQEKGGFIYHVGAGYQLPAFKSTALFFTAAYSEKRHTEEMQVMSPCFDGPCPEYAENWAYRFKRLSLTTGLRF